MVMAMSRASLVHCLFFLSLPWSVSAKVEPSLLQEWVHQARCGPTGNAIWVYEGYLSDPLTGKRVAAVEGLELIRSLASSSRPRTLSNSKKQQQDKNQNIPHHPHYDASLLQVGPTLANPNATYSSAETILTRRLFCYKPVASDTTTTSTSSQKQKQQEDDTSSSTPNLLREIRLRPTSPIRRIPLEQAVTVYDSATTFVQPHSTKKQNNKFYIDDRDEEDSFWHVHTEWPNGKALWTKALLGTSTSRHRSNNPSAEQKRHVDFTVYARPQSKLQRKLQAPNLSWMNSNQNPRETATTSSPARSALIQFGSSNPGSTQHEQDQAKFGARETYQWSYSPSSAYAPDGSSSSKSRWKRLWGRVRRRNNRGNYNYHPDGTPAATVRYTRYGEGPVWYGSAGGRMCTVELTGRRIDYETRRNDDELHQVASQTPAAVAAQHVPDFWSILEPSQAATGRTVRDDPAAAIHSFRQAPAVAVVPDPQEILNTHPLLQWQQRAERIVQRIRAATTWSVGGRVK